MRDIPMTPKAEMAFQLIVTLLGKHHAPDDLIFPADGYEAYYRRCKAAFAHALDCDLDTLTKNYATHTMRKTMASALYKAGVPVKVIQKILGHKSLSMTMRYCHDFTDEDEVRDIITKAIG